MNVPASLTVSLGVGLGSGIVQKYYANKTQSGFLPTFLYNGLSAFFSAIVFLLWGGLGEISLYTVLLGTLFGVIVSLQGIFTMYALQIGPMSFSHVIISFSTVLTALSGALFWNEKLKVLQIIGIVLMMASFVFAVEKDKDEKSASWKWLLVCLFALFCSGGVGLMQKIHQSSAHKRELNAFLIMAFAVCCVISFVFAFFFKRKEAETPLFPRTEKGKIHWLLMAVIVLAGVLTAVNHKLNLYLSGVMDSAVFFPIVNGGGLVLSTLAALVIFREKLTKKQWVGVILGIFSVLFLCL